MGDSVVRVRLVLENSWRLRYCSLGLHRWSGGVRLYLSTASREGAAVLPDVQGLLDESPHEPAMTAVRDCDHCGEPFKLKRPDRPGQRYCSKECGRHATSAGKARPRVPCSFDGIAYKDHPKCGGLPTPHLYGDGEGEDDRPDRRPRRCGLLVGPGHAYDKHDLRPDGRCRFCHDEDARSLDRLGRRPAVSLYPVDWLAPLPVTWTPPGPKVMDSVVTPQQMASRRRWNERRRGKEQSA